MGEEDTTAKTLLNVLDSFNNAQEIKSIKGGDFKLFVKYLPKIINFLKKGITEGATGCIFFDDRFKHQEREEILYALAILIDLTKKYEIWWHKEIWQFLEFLGKQWGLNEY